MSEQQPPRDPYGQQEQRRGEGRPPHPPQQQPCRQQSRQPALTPDPQCGPPNGSPLCRGQWPAGRPGGQQACPGPGYGYGPQPPGKQPRKRAHWVRMLAGIGALVVAIAVLSPISARDSAGTSSGAAGSAASAAAASFSSAAKPAAARTVAAFSGSRQENTPDSP